MKWTQMQMQRRIPLCGQPRQQLAMEVLEVSLLLRVVQQEVSIPTQSRALLELQVVQQPPKLEQAQRTRWQSLLATTH
jgi:hypothetical protein